MRRYPTDSLFSEFNIFSFVSAVSRINPHNIIYFHFEHNRTEMWRHTLIEKNVYVSAYILKQKLVVVEHFKDWDFEKYNKLYHKFKMYKS